MSGLNLVQIIGHLGADPEVKYGANGDAVTKIRIATTERWKKDGETQERTTWHTVVAFKRLAEIIGEYCRKGMQVYISGSLRVSEYEKNGEKRYYTDIVAKEMQMLGGRGEQKPAPTQAPADNDFDDGVPF